VGDRLVGVGDRPLAGATREEAVEALLALGDHVSLLVDQHDPDQPGGGDFAAVIFFLFKNIYFFNKNYD
jgi:hypothetical protein